MATCLHGLLLASEAARVPAGIRFGGGPARVLTTGERAAIVSDAVAIPASVENLTSHDLLLREIVSRGITVLAARFGQRFADDAACEAYLRSPDASTPFELLEKRNGLAEMRLVSRNVAAAEPKASGKPGTDYLESLKRSAMPPAMVDVDSRFRGIAVAQAVEARRDTSVVAHLVAHEDVARYLSIVARDPQFGSTAVIGPLPLYAFAEAS